MRLSKILKLVCFLAPFYAVSAQAVPVLQLGPESGGTYVGGGDDTWYLDGTDSGFSFNAYNLGTDTDSWSLLTSYIVISAVPEATTDAFDITVSDDSGVLSLVQQGYGAPPYQDPNSLAPHSIYDTWYEVYALNFDGLYGAVCNTEPGYETDCTRGYTETIDVLINSLDVSGLHIDMFNVNLDLQVTSFAPFSHDAQFVPGTPSVPVPAALWLFGSGLLGLVGVARRRKA